MPISINKFPVLSGYSDARLALVNVPGTKKRVRLRKDIAAIFQAILSEIDKTVVDLDGGPLDGFARRQARAADAWSNHASGTAVDFRYDIFPADRRRHMSKAQTDQMHRLLKKYVAKKGGTSKKIFIWGGDWTVGKYIDEMHLEIARGVTVDDVHLAMQQIGINADGTFKKKPAPVPTPVKPPVPRPLVEVHNVQPGDNNTDVRVVQAALVKAGLLAKIHLGPGPKGIFGPKTKEAYRKWQIKCGYRGADADGKPGLESLTLLGNKYGFKTVK